MLTRLFRRADVRQSGLAIPCTDGRSLWLPMDMPLAPPRAAAGAIIDAAEVKAYRRNAGELFRTIGLQQASRVLRGSADHVAEAAALCPRTLALYTVLEAQAADERLVQELPGMARSVNQLREKMLALRPAINAVPTACRHVEKLVQRILSCEVGTPVSHLPWPPSTNARENVEIASWLLRQHGDGGGKLPHQHALFKDCWTGEILPAPAEM